MNADAKTGRTNIVILCFTLSVVMMGFGIIIPILPFYIDRFNAGGTTLGLLMAVFAVMQFLFAPVWGALSDRCGRKPLLVLGILGNALSHLLFALSTQLWMLFAARALAGILSAATMPAAMAYISDTTGPRERSSGMGALRAALGVGIIFGPGLGGWFASESLSLPFYMAAVFSLLALVPVWLALPESLPQHRRARAKAELPKPRPGVLWEALLGPIGFLLLMAFLLSFGLTGFEGIFALYASKLYGYGPGRVGTVIVLIGIVSAAMQLLLTGPLCRRWGEAAVIKGSMIICASGFLLMLQARTFSQVLITVALFVIGSALLRPAVSSLISKRTSASQGNAMGLNSSFTSLGRVFGPACAGILFDMKMSYPYMGGAAVMLTGFVACLLWLEGGHPAALPNDGHR